MLKNINMKKELLKKIFQEHKNRWWKDTMFLSNISDITNHPDYQAIIALGKDVVPIIIEDFKTINSGQWSQALIVLTGSNPIKSEHMGNIALMKRDWEEWWKIHHSEYE